MLQSSRKVREADERTALPPVPGPCALHRVGPQVVAVPSSAGDCCESKLCGRCREEPEEERENEMGDGAMGDSGE